MVPKPIKLNTLIATAALFLITHGAADFIYQYINSMAVVGLALLVQIAALVAIVIQMEGGLATVGWTPGTWLFGLKKGALWSLGFALVAALGMVVLVGVGKNPIAMLRFTLPSNPVELILYFSVGGLIAPIAEELCFRGVLYTYFRQWGFLFALVVSSVIFVLLHLLTVKGMPVTQIVGGIVFAIAYETTSNLMVPITIHALGNLAIFSLSLF